MSYREYMESCINDCKCKGELFAKSDAERLILKLAEKLDASLSRKRVAVVCEKTETTITATTTYDDGSTSVAIAYLDENGKAKTVVENGVECKITWL